MSMSEDYKCLPLCYNSHELYGLSFSSQFMTRLPAKF